MIRFQPFAFRRCSLSLGQLGLVVCRLQDLRAPLLGALSVAGDQLALRAPPLHDCYFTYAVKYLNVREIGRPYDGGYI